jgi:glycosyltransferase involved in cell wall biosynthesis
MKRARVLASAFTCCPEANPGFTGGEDVLGWNLIQQISKHHDLWVITQAEDREAIEWQIQVQGITGINFEFVDLPSWLKPFLKIQGGHQIYNYLWQVRTYFTARRLHKRLNFDLFHHVTYANDWMASYIGALLPVPYVRGPGGGAQRTPPSLMNEYTAKGRFWERVRTIGQWFFRHDPFFIAGQRRASALLLCNKDSMAAIHFRWTSKVHLYPVSGVPLEDLELAKNGIPSADHSLSNAPSNTPFKVISAGSLIRVKGFGLTLKAFKEFNDKHPNSQLTIVGGGPERPRLEELIHRFNLEDKVILTGAMPRLELMKMMAASSVMLFTSLRDGGGTVVIEAMSTGTPVVCLDSGGPGLHVTEECGIKIEPSSPEATTTALADAIESLYSDPKLLADLGKAAHEKAAQMYAWEHLGERLMKIYNPVLDPGMVANSVSSEEQEAGS